MNDSIRVVLLEPGKEARPVEIGHTLEDMEEIVGGMIEAFYPFFDEDVCIVCNEEGKLIGLPLNRAIYEDVQGGKILDIIAGTCFICDCSGTDFGSLNQEQIDRYIEKYRYPEHFIRINGKIVAFPYKPTNSES